ncbi:cellulose biosynthesis cyclic di-GMP-binding regulatory protein BcsB [Klebsiella pneumoniae]|nr:cellulose biosynthesis cyclic di-GMP-binding regulatory protein BcsB [Klebsiella pneumoniae]
MTDFNRVRLEFVGHYRDVCENPKPQQYAVAGRRTRKLSGSHLPVAEGK